MDSYVAREGLTWNSTCLRHLRIERNNTILICNLDIKIVKIALISFFQDFQQTGNFKSGGPAHLFMMLREWRKRGNLVEVLGVKRDFNIYSNSLAFLEDLVKRRFNKFPGSDYDIYICASPYPLDFLSFLKAARGNLERGFVYSRLIPPFLLWKPFKRGFFRATLNYFHSRLVISVCKIFNIGIILDQPQAYNFGSLKVIGNEYAVELSEPVDIQLSENKQWDIFFMGRIQKNKGVFDIVKAINVLRRKGLNLKAAIAGEIYDKKYFESINRYIRKFNIESIHFLGVTDDVKKVAFLKTSKLFVFPSYEDSWAIAGMEAAYFGLPVIAYELPAYSYLEGNYWKVEPGNINELAETIENCINNKSDLSRKTTIAMRLVRNYTFENIAIKELDSMLHSIGR